MPPAYELKGTILKIQDVCLSFGDTQVLKNVSAEIRDIVRPGTTTGQIVGFLGPSGIGKTQLFRIIAGLNPPTSGQVTISNCSCGLPDCAKENCPVEAGAVGVVAQNYPLFPHRTVFSNLVRAAMKRETDRQIAIEKVRSYLVDFDLTDKGWLYPCQLSGGQKQRVAILQQILCSEHLLLMDEPFSGLDLISLKKVATLISKIANLDELNTIIVVTHDVTSACMVSDHLWLMGRERDEQGNIIPGAKIMKTYNLIDQDLCWHPEIAKTTPFLEFVREVKDTFERL